KKKYYKKALIHFNNIMNKSLFKKELYNNIIKKIASCHFYLKKYDLAINFFKILLKDNIDAEENLFHLGMCYYLQSNDYFFFQKNRIKSIKIFLFLRKNYPNTKYLPKIEKMICVSYFKKEKRVNILIKNRNLRLMIIKMFLIFYIYMIISQSKVEKENSCFEETMKLHNTYFIYKMKILFLMRSIYLSHRKFK
ncbi:tetratricopeptide repeat protein, partial [Candidatus Karelsulcia muelleri]|uniref:tetratricopeptide repeat protein n=1 Tax=Candidatus Karelsulcia muelleri TaxID=336810 RepID=UPI00216B5E24